MKMSSKLGFTMLATLLLMGCGNQARIRELEEGIEEFKTKELAPLQAQHNRKLREISSLEEKISNNFEIIRVNQEDISSLNEFQEILRDLIDLHEDININASRMGLSFGQAFSYLNNIRDMINDDIGPVLRDRFEVPFSRMQNPDIGEVRDNMISLAVALPFRSLELLEENEALLEIIDVKMEHLEAYKQREASKRLILGTLNSSLRSKELELAELQN